MAFGSIEIIGMSNAIFIADIMLKCSSIKILKIEHKQKGGFVSVSISGNTGDVETAIDSVIHNNKFNILGYNLIPNFDENILSTISDNFKKTKLKKNKIKVTLPIHKTKQQKKEKFTSKKIDDKKQNKEELKVIGKISKKINSETISKNIKEEKTTKKISDITVNKKVKRKPDCDYLCDLCDLKNCIERKEK